MKVFLVSLTIFDDDDEYDVRQKIFKSKCFKTKQLAEIYVANNIFKLLRQNKKQIDDKLRSTGSHKYKTPYVNKDGIVDRKYKDDLNIMLLLREKLLSSDVHSVCDYLIEYDIDEEDIIEELESL
jgi:hypothetical protein